MASIIKQIQEDVERRIEELLPEAVEVISRRRGHISNDIAAALAKKKMAVLCFPPSIGGIKPNIGSSLYADGCEMEVHVCEAPTLNKTGIDAYEAVERLLSLNLYKTSGGTLVSVKEVLDGSPEDKKIVEFVITLSLSSIAFPRIA